MKNITLFLLFVLLSVQASYASHFSGGQLWCEYNGTNYTIHLRLFSSCAPGSIQASLRAEIYFNSSKLNKSFQRVLNVVSEDTVSIKCDDSNSCIIPSLANKYPGHVVSDFVDTVSLDKTDDWEIYYSTCCLSNSLVNISNSNPNSLGATLDNAQKDRSSIHFGDIANYYNIIKDTIRVPLQYISLNKADSIKVNVVEPYLKFRQSTIPYSTGYSRQHPLGANSVFYYDNSTQEIVISASMTGVYYFALDITEYKSGKILSYSHIQSEVYAFPSVIPGYNNKPFLKKNTYLDIAACENQSGIKTLQFRDTTSNDSIYVDVIYPANNSTYTISHNVVSDTGKATVSINWATGTAAHKPTEAREIILHYGTKTDTCSYYKGTYVVTLHLTDSCSTDSVWPGDANNDKIVSLKDVLAIGGNYNKLGYQRMNTSNNWQAYYCSDWKDSWSNQHINTKYADCNGDGQVDTADLHVITANFSKTHPKPAPNKPTAGPDIYLDTTGIVFAPGATVTVPVVLGNSTHMLTSGLYGWAADITIGGLNLSAQPGISVANSWLTPAKDDIQYKHPGGNGHIGWAHVRTNGSSVHNGYGTLAEVSFTIPANTILGTKINLDLNNVTLIDSEGNELTNYNVKAMTAIVDWPTDITTTGQNGIRAFVVPNPSSGKAYLHITNDVAETYQVSVVNVMGRQVVHTHVSYEKGQHTLELADDQLPPATYIIHMTDSNGNTQHVKWVKW